MKPEERQAHLSRLRELLAQIESGEINAGPSNEEAMEQLRAEIAVFEAGTPLDREPGFVSVGHPYPSGRILPGSLLLHPDSAPMMMILGLGSPSPADFAAFHFKEGWIEFALVPMGKLLVTLIRFPTKIISEQVRWGLWMDVPWAHRKDNAFDPKILHLETQDTRYLVSCLLVDSDTNLVVGMQAFTLSPHYSRMYERELASRLNGPPITPEEYVRLADTYQRQYPVPKKLLGRAIVRCKAGLPGK